MAISVNPDFPAELHEVCVVLITMPVAIVNIIDEKGCFRHRWMLQVVAVNGDEFSDAFSSLRDHWAGLL